MTGRQPITERRQHVIDLAVVEKLWPSAIARQVGMSRAGVESLLQRYGAPIHGYAKKQCKKAAGVGQVRGARDKERASRMAAMYRQGLTLGKIGEHFGVTRERVRQILRRDAVLPSDGGQAAIKRARADARQAKRDAESLRRYGLASAEVQKYRASGVLRGFVSQRGAAHARGIAWSLTFAQWLSIWLASGKLAQRGRGRHGFVMSRIKDEGGYVVGNVHIQSSVENNSQGIQKVIERRRAGARVAHTGIWRMYPGLAKPWIAKYSRKLIGMFATEAEAVAARDEYMRANKLYSSAVGQGRGWTYVAKCKRRPYCMQIAGSKCLYFASAEEAEAAYQRAAQEILSKKA